MPNSPQLEGQPPWLQIIITLVFGAATLLVAFRGYFQKPPMQPGQGPDSAQIIGAQFADMGAIRRLGEICIELASQIESFERALREQTHWTREEIELRKEECARLRELREALERRQGG